ncbi:MAG: response regulator [Polyangiales bacterium]
MKRRVLIVDDEFGLAEVMGELVSERGFVVSIAMNGKLALADMEQNPPHLVLLDIMMPIMDGPTMLKRLREEPRFSDIPVVLMSSLPQSALSQLDGLYQALVRKPFSPEVLYDLLDRYLPDSE